MPSNSPSLSAVSRETIRILKEALVRTTLERDEARNEAAELEAERDSALMEVSALCSAEEQRGRTAWQPDHTVKMALVSVQASNIVSGMALALRKLPQTSEVPKAAALVLTCALLSARRIMDWIRFDLATAPPIVHSMWDRFWRELTAEEAEHHRRQATRPLHELTAPEHESPEAGIIHTAYWESVLETRRKMARMEHQAACGVRLRDAKNYFSGWEDQSNYQRFLKANYGWQGDMECSGTTEEPPNEGPQ